ncbi:MAG TPA: PorV/PorQ family protein [bacterium]|nr:PorV/PorQ family protein [bacterium]HPN43638.1 PorV/PorQ family protein [bacterium]
MKKVIISLVCIFMLLFSFAQVYAVSEAAVLFLMISPGARAAGMGEAFVALADDATAVFWNPAGLAFQQGREVTLMHANWLPQFGSDLFYEFGAYRQSFEGIGTVGFNITYLNLGKQSVTLETGPEVVDEFSSNEFAISGTFGTKLNEDLGVGLGLRYIRSNLSPIGAGSEKGDGRANAFSFDVSALYHTPFLKKLSFGINLSNLGPKITYIDAAQADPIPTNLKVGFAYRIIDDEFNKLTVVGDLNHLMVKRYSDGTSDAWYKALFTSPWTVVEKETQNIGGDEEKVTGEKKLFNGILSGGVEYWYSNLIALRAGYYWDEPGKVNFTSFGAGIQYNLYRFDFGYVNAAEGHPLSNTMRFSLTLGF